MNGWWIVDAGAKCAGVFADAPCRVQIPARIVKQYQTKLTEVVMVALLGGAVIIRQQGLALYLKQRDWLNYAVVKDKHG